MMVDLVMRQRREEVENAVKECLHDLLEKYQLSLAPLEKDVVEILFPIIDDATSLHENLRQAKSDIENGIREEWLEHGGRLMLDYLEGQIRASGNKLTR